MSVIDSINVMKRKMGEKIKSSLINETAPAASYMRGVPTPTIQELREFSERYPLSSILPYESYDPDTQLYFNRDTVGFMLAGVPAVGLSSTELNVLNGFFNQLHKPDTSIQITIVSDSNIEPILNVWKDNKGDVEDEHNAKIFKLLAENRVSYLKNGKWGSLFSDQSCLLRNMHLIISYTIPVPSGMKAHELPEDDIAFLERTRDATIGTLRSAKIFCKPMQPSLFINIMNGTLNPSHDPQPILYYDENNLINQQIVDQDSVYLFNSGVSSIIHKEQPFSIQQYHVRQFPQKWPGFNNGSLIGSFTNNILRLPCPFILTLNVNIPDQVSAKGRVTTKSARATQMASSPISKFATQWHDRKKDWDFTAKKVDDGNKLMDAFFQIVLLSPLGQEQVCEQALRSVYESLGWILTKSRYTPIHTFLGALPMGMCQETKKALKTFGHYRSRLSWTCTNVAPWIGEWKGTQNPMMLFMGRRGQLAFFDPFDNNKGNFNISCCAASGAGKSFFTQEWISCILGTGGRAFVFDAGHSYKNICKLLNGTYLDFGDKEHKPILNPFSHISDADPEFFEEQMPLLKMLISQMAAPENPLNQKQTAVLEKAIYKTWQEYKEKSSITKLVQILKRSDEDDTPMYATADDLATMLFSYTEDGMYGHLFEGESNINLDNTFVVLDLDALNQTPDLQSVVLLILMMRITQVMYLSKNKKQRKLCIIDEAWRLLGRGKAGAFIEEGYRVARKHGGSFMTITQKISDYFASETANAAYMNSDFVIYLRQKPEELQSAEVKGHIDNSDGKIDVLKTIDTIQGKYSELAISSPDGLAVLRFLVDPITEKIYSTKAEEVDFIRQAESRGIGLLDAVNMLIEQSSSR